VKINNRQQMLAIAAGAIVALFAADKMILTPLAHSWSARSERIEKLRKQVADGRGLIQRERSLRARWEDMRSNALSNNTSVAEQQMLKGVDRWGQGSRTTILSISPQWKHDTEEYMTLECRVEASGSLDSISRFLFNLERDPLAIKVQSADITSHDTDGRQFSLGLQISGLVLASQDTRPPTGPAGTSRGAR
jgi:hypothetical protein